MNHFLVWILVAAAVIAFYAMFGRELLRKTEWGCKLLTWIEPVELLLWKKSETILWARFKVFVGALLAFLTSIGTLDLTPFVVFLPTEHQDLARKVVGLLPLLISVVGLVDEKLRRTTTKPLEVVSVPSDAPPEVRAVVDTVTVTNLEAVAAVREAKAEGKV